MVFPSHRVGVGSAMIRSLGHGGVVVINQDGSTHYWEYGRYDKEQMGIVRELETPSVCAANPAR